MVLFVSLNNVEIESAKLAWDSIFQSKSTTTWEIDGDKIVYDLKADAYNDLIERSGSGCLPFLLILLCLPTDEISWLNVSDTGLIPQKCAYWTKLDGNLTTKTATRRIRIPQANVFTPQAHSRQVKAEMADSTGDFRVRLSLTTCFGSE